MKKFIAAILCLFLFSAPALAADPALEAVKAPLDKAMAVLNDPQFADGQNAEKQRELLWDCIEEVFNFVEVAKRSVGRNWKKFTPEERKDFTEIFSRVLGDAYLSRIQTGYEGDTIDYLGVEAGSKDDKAVVQTVIQRPGMQIPVDYSMLNKKGKWEVYDVKIEGISLVKNYRSQFDKKLMNMKPAELIQELKEKKLSE
ncbi:phospholipid transport system substrate-binding protein [Desulfatibacillum alkenivorans DSM 16219]|jgi:phospholipid transport system substrate-binding protein|uniref:Phospholipid transport system substrate-binding protein n=1 Tax=Desulfatibacillum alkenivorans DSM 16219 TaxID=1121393 RepID=A0A1M6RPL7_9BACT|nr:ABC transporter substrate-binding protein [Desulfatibacillum alkenivorans]SHK34267.1 phospholipid transport system substrate-binding protein [Desulfatibacillum alkenivorans DSM 16219]